ncbi:MAG: aryl-sulfate sulfotransferase [Promethearchaeota archaeon]
MIMILTLNRHFQQFFTLIFIIALFLFVPSYFGFFIPANDKTGSFSSYDNGITKLHQTSQEFFNEDLPNLVSKKESEVKGVEVSTHVIHSGEYFDGYNIFQFRNFNDPPYSFRITDMEGNIINTFPSKNNYGYAQPINSTTFLLVSSAPSYFWNIETGKNVSIPFGSHHDISYNPRTKTFITLNMDYIVDGDYTYKYDIIRERNITGVILWELHTQTFIPFSWWSGELMGGNRDITHSNSVFWDIEEDMIYLLCRNLNTFFKIEHSTGRIVWGLGEHGNFTLFDQKGNQRENLFYHAHALEKVDDNTFILFDNDYLNQTNLNNHRSRILEISINETTMTANVSWSWTGTREYYSAYWGDADRLPNGNRLGTFGTENHDGTDIGPRLVEVNASGDVVWEMYYKGASMGIFKAERFRLTPILDSPEDKIIREEEAFKLTWQTWYNFRARLKMNGSYILYQNGQVINDGEVLFNQLWLPTNLTFDLSPLDLGEHNFTLLVSDEGGKITKDTIIVTTKDFLVYRDGPHQIELGQKNGSIQWTGTSTPPLIGKIYNNNSLLEIFTWNGSKKELDLNSLALGKHNITFLLYNEVEKQYCDTFWVTVYSSTPPIVISKPNDMKLWLNQTNISLKWKIYDLSPWNFTILVNNFIVKSGPWDGSDITFIFNSSTIGKFLVTLIVFDILGNDAEDRVIINILATTSSTSTSTTTTTPISTTTTITTTTPISTSTSISTTTTTISSSSTPSSTSSTTSTKVKYAIIGLILGLGTLILWRKRKKRL